MKQYKKQIDGNTVIKSRNEIVLRVTRTVVGKDGNEKAIHSKVYNPNDEMLLADGWVEYVKPEPTSEELLERAKEGKVREIERYDSSDSVNTCVISMAENDIHYWADKTERSSLKTAVQDCLAMGRTEYRLDLRDAGVSVSIPCKKLLQMLAALEVYAIDCYNKTTDHIFAVNALQTIEEVEAYDFKVGYPNVLTIEL